MAITLAFQARDEGSIPFTRSTLSSALPPSFPFFPLFFITPFFGAWWLCRLCSLHRLGTADSVGLGLRVPVRDDVRGFLRCYEYDMGLTQGQTHGEVCDGNRG